jgi:hypothetical protein
MRSFMSMVAPVLLLAVCYSQVLLKPQDIPTISKVLDTFHGPNSLKCEVQHGEPKLDFSFRWVVTYGADCSSSKLGPEERLVAYLRLQPRDGEPTYFVDPEVNANTPAGQQRHIALTDPSLNLWNPRAIAVGEGDYTVDFLLGSTNGRMFRKQWSFRTRYHKNPELAGLPPKSAEVFKTKKWNEKLTPAGPKLTILLHATVLPRSHQVSIPKSKDVATDERAYSLSSLSALLAHIPHRSVDVAAFSIEHEEEIFRQQNFNEEGYRQLSEALSKQEIGQTVIAGALQPETLSRFLLALVKKDEAEKGTGRIVVFLGPTAWLSRLEITKDLKEDFQNADTRLFYFQYYDPSIYGRENLEHGGGLMIPGQSVDSLPRYPKDGVWKGDKTPDSIDYLMKALGGQILRVHSAEEFQQAIEEMLDRMKLSSR